MAKYQGLIWSAPRDPGFIDWTKRVLKEPDLRKITKKSELMESLEQGKR
jgi:hypothetical protein